MKKHPQGVRDVSCTNHRGGQEMVTAVMGINSATRERSG